MAGVADLGERVQLAHEARVQVDGGVEPAVGVHGLDLRPVLRVLESGR